jgi:hypothetical protein
MSWLPAVVVVAILACAVGVVVLRTVSAAGAGAWERAAQPPLEPTFAPLGLAHIRRELRHTRTGAPTPSLDALLVDAVRARAREARIDVTDVDAVRSTLGREATVVLEGRPLGRTSLERLLDRLEAR